MQQSVNRSEQMVHNQNFIQKLVNAQISPYENFSVLSAKELLKVQVKHILIF